MWRPAILQKAEAALLDEKASKLVGLARVLDRQLGAGFDAHLAGAGLSPDAPASDRLQALSAALGPIADDLAGAFPSVGVGYYDARLDCIVAYGPTATLGYLVGVSPAEDHLGRAAMRERADKVAVGSMVRGDAMNCMHPIIREDRVIGFAFANESLEDIYRQMNAGSSRSYQSAEFAAVLGLSSLAVFAGTSAMSAGALRAQLASAVAAGLASEEALYPLTHGLWQMEQYIRLFLGNLQAGVVLVGPGGLVEYISPGMLSLAGIAAEAAAPGTPWADLAEWLGLPPAEGETHQYRAVRLNGREVDILAAVVPAPAALGGSAPPYRIFLVEDTERTRQESEYYERAERLALAGELATAIAHEIRNPLTVVHGSIQLIPQRLDDQEFLLSLSQIAGRELGRVNRTIQGLLGFARYSEPRMQLVDLGEVIGQAVEFIRWYAGKNGVEVDLHLPQERLRVYGDAEHLQQALLNLMINGIQAMADGGTLTIRAAHPGGSRLIRLAIEDQGRGIDPDQLPKIWEVFYSSKPGGTGLGLPVVQRIVDEHRGQVEVESVPGKGTCFTVLLPVTTRADVAAEEEA